MLIKPITYETFDGAVVTENFYFNYTKAELMEMELLENGNLREQLDAIVKSGEGKVIIPKFKEIVRSAYGLRSPDGKIFRKSPEISADFENHAAYSVFFEELVTDANAATAFINGIMPAALVAQVQAEAAQGGQDVTSEVAKAALVQRASEQGAQDALALHREQQAQANTPASSDDLEAERAERSRLARERSEAALRGRQQKEAADEEARAEARRLREQRIAEVQAERAAAVDPLTQPEPKLTPEMTAEQAELERLRERLRGAGLEAD